MATTSTFKLRKMIQTRLHQEEDHSHPAEDENVSYFEEDDEHNPITRRLTLWLAPRRGSTSGTVHSRSSSEIRRSLSPLPPTIPHSAQRTNASDSVGVLKPNSPLGRCAKKQDPKRRTLNDVPPPRPSPRPINDGGSATSSFDGSFVLQGTTGGQDTMSKPTRPQTFLTSPTHSKDPEPASTHTDSTHDTAPTTAKTPAMDQSHAKNPGPSVRRQTREWSEGVQQLILETDQAFEGVGNSFGPSNLKVPRLSTDMSQSNPDLLSHLAPEPLVVEKMENRENMGPKAEAPLEVPQRRSSAVKDAALIAERRKSRSVPPPIQVGRKASPPPDTATDDKPPPVPPKSARPAPKSAREASKPLREPPKSAKETPTHKGSISAHKGSVSTHKGSVSAHKGSISTHKGSISTQRGSVSHNETPPLKPRENSVNSISARSQRQGPPSCRRPSKTSRWGIGETGSIRSVFKRNEVEELISPEEMDKLRLERDEAKFKSSISKLPRKFRESAAPDAGKGHRTRPSQDSIPELADLLSEDDDDLDIPPEIAELSASPYMKDETASDSQKASAVDEGYGSSKSSSDEGCSPKKSSTSDEEDDDVRPPIPPRKSVARGRQPSRDDAEEMDGLKTVDLMEDQAEEEDSVAAPPPKNPNRYTSSGEQVPSLPEKSSRRQTATADNLKGEEDDEYYYLKSTPYSMTTPSFRQGPIAFPKSEMGKGVRKMDDTLDWTAFQMAIIGADEFLPDIYDDGDGRFADDLKSWFKGFGFDTYGELIPEDEPSSPRSSLDSGSSVASADNEPPAPVDTPATNVNGYDATKFFQGKGLKQWTMEGKQAKPSVPQKPTDPHQPTAVNPVVVDNEDNKQASEHQEGVSLGYNLNNDLGDFLKWEAQTFGSGYYGTH